MPYTQTYDPFNNPLLSTLVAALPLVVLLGGMLILKWKAPLAAALGLACSVLLALTGYRMPAGMVAASTLFGAAYGFLPIGWIILNVFFLFHLVDGKGFFSRLQDSLTRVTRDQRLQLLLVAFCLGALFEGTSGFGTPVAITSVILIGLGFPKLKAALLALIANSTPVVFGSIGTGMVLLQGVTGLDLGELSRATALQLLPLNLILPIWLVWTFAGLRRTLQVWPAILVTSLTFSATQTALAVWHGPWLATISAAVVSLVALLILYRFWQPRDIFMVVPEKARVPAPNGSVGENLRTWTPWLILILVVFLWGITPVKTLLERSDVLIPIKALDQMVLRTPPIVPAAQTLPATFNLAWLSTTGTAVLIAALLGGLAMGHDLRSLLAAYGKAARQASAALLTILLLVALGFVSRFSGQDATLGMAFARTGLAYPFFGTILGWLGVISTGSVASSNSLFGSLQAISAGQLGIDPAFMAAANSSGGMAGKLISPQSLAITATATSLEGCEPALLRKALPHSLAMIAFMGLVVLLELLL